MRLDIKHGVAIKGCFVHIVQNVDGVPVDDLDHPSREVRPVLRLQLHRQAEALQAADNKNRQLQNKLKTQQELSGRTARIPRLRRTNKTSRVYALDDLRLYRVTTVQGAIDETDCERTYVANVVTIRPRPASGMEISSRDPPADIKEKFSGVDDGDEFVQLFVSRDSFAAFLPVKDTLVQLGLEYEVLITDGDDVELHPRGSTRESFVQ